MDFSNMKFWHGSMDQLKIGTILMPTSNYEERWNSTDFYNVLERYRPLHCLAHKNSVFMCDNDNDIDCAGGGTEWVFEVKPLGAIERHDMNWSSEISGAICENAPEETLREYAMNYWNGLPHHSESVWEYLTTSAVIISVERF